MKVWSSKPSRDGLEQGLLLLLSCRLPAPLLTVGQLPRLEGPQLDLVDDGAVVGDGDVVGVLESVAVAVEVGDEGAGVDVDDEALRLLLVEHAEGLGAAHRVDPATCGKFKQLSIELGSLNRK